MWALDGETQFGGKASKYILLCQKSQNSRILEKNKNSRKEQESFQKGQAHKKL